MYSNLDCCRASIHNFKFDTIAVTTEVVSSMEIALMTTATITTAANKQHATIMKKLLSAMGTGKTTKTITKEGK